MDNAISYQDYLANSYDDEIWKPIKKEEYEIFDQLIADVHKSRNKGRNHDKGNTLEKLMHFIYARFLHSVYSHNLRVKDNEIDHQLKFLDTPLIPPFITTHFGLVILGESKNQNVSIGSRDVANFEDLLKSNKVKLGIFTSYKPFSRGKNLWQNAEGRRRKLALMNNYERIIIGFTLEELMSLKNNNFYTMIKDKYNQVIEELNDDFTDCKPSNDYHDNIYETLSHYHSMGIIDSHTLEESKSRLEEKFGPLTY